MPRVPHHTEPLGILAWYRCRQKDGPPTRLPCEVALLDGAAQVAWVDVLAGGRLWRRPVRLRALSIMTFAEEDRWRPQLSSRRTPG